jgi:ADP-heptose:LPS heptosyltransferase
VLWRGLDYIAKPGEHSDVQLVDSPQLRRYRERADEMGSTWQAYRPIPAEIVFTAAEHAVAARVPKGFVVIEPHIKRGRDGAANKDWGWQRYADVVARLPDIRWLQMGDRYSRPLPGVEFVPTATFRQACAILARARAYLGPEGGLHHACAALCVPAVVIFGGYVSPAVTGYEGHVNLFSGRGLGCGRRLACDCSCMATISCELAAAELRALLLRVDRASSP